MFNEDVDLALRAAYAAGRAAGSADPSPAGRPPAFPPASPAADLAAIEAELARLKNRFHFLPEDPAPGDRWHH